MKRLFWVALGATAGVLVVRAVTKKAEAFTPAGLAASVNGLADAVGDFAEDVRAAMAEREHELLTALGVDDGDLSPEQVARLLEHPAIEREDHR